MSRPLGNQESSQEKLLTENCYREQFMKENVMKWKSVFVLVGFLLSVFFVLGAIRFFGTMEPVIVKIEPALLGLEVVNREKLAVA